MQKTKAMAEKMAKLNTDQDVRDAVINHEAYISALSGRITGVEDALKTVRVDISGIKRDMSTGFASVLQKISESKAETGQQWTKLLGGGAALAAILGGITYAITTLVNSNVAAPLVTLDTKVRHAEQQISDSKDEDRQELLQYRKDRKALVDRQIESIAQKIDRLEEKMQWAPRVEARR